MNLPAAADEGCFPIGEIELIDNGGIHCMQLAETLSEPAGGQLQPSVRPAANC